MALRQQPAIFLKFMAWLPLGFAITVAIGFAYVGVQQNLRQSANDPQIQLVEDAIQKLQTGADPKDVIPTTSVNINESSEPYVIVYSHDGAPIAGSGRLNGTIPTPPIGVLLGGPEPAGPWTGSYNAVTWQPLPTIRQAVVTEQTSGLNGETVLAGRSLYEVERRESQLGVMALSAWFVAMLGSIILSFVVGQASAKRPS